MFEVMKRKRHRPLESGSNILKAKRHLTIGECTPRTNKCCFVLVFRFDLYLIISRKTIHEINDFSTHTLIDNMINKWGWKIIF